MFVYREKSIINFFGQNAVYVEPDVIIGGPYTTCD